MRQAALVCRAYLSLCLNDPLSSLSAATDLLHMEPRATNQYLAHTYAAEVTTAPGLRVCSGARRH